MRCPYLNYVDGGWGSGDYYCKLTGLLVGTLHDHVKVDHCCDCNAFFDCPIYKRRQNYT